MLLLGNLWVRMFNYFLKYRSILFQLISSFFWYLLILLLSPKYPDQLGVYSILIPLFLSASAILLSDARKRRLSELISLEVFFCRLRITSLILYLALACCCLFLIVSGYYVACLLLLLTYLQSQAILTVDFIEARNCLGFREYSKFLAFIYVFYGCLFNFVVLLFAFLFPSSNVSYLILSGISFLFISINSFRVFSSRIMSCFSDLTLIRSSFPKPSEILPIFLKKFDTNIFPLYLAAVTSISFLGIMQPYIAASKLLIFFVPLYLKLVYGQVTTNYFSAFKKLQLLFLITLLSVPFAYFLNVSLSLFLNYKDFTFLLSILVCFYISLQGPKALLSDLFLHHSSSSKSSAISDFLLFHLLCILPKVLFLLLFSRFNSPLFTPSFFVFCYALSDLALSILFTFRYKNNILSLRSST